MNWRCARVLVATLVLAPGRGAAIQPVTAEIAVPTYTTLRQWHPDVAMAADRSFVVVWQYTPNAGTSSGIRGRRFGELGAALTPEFNVESYTLGLHGTPFVAGNTDGSFVVAWLNDLADGSLRGVRARTFVSNGVATSAELAINTYTTDDQWTSGLDIAPDGSFVIVWQSDTQDGSGSGVFGRRFHSTGAAATAEFQVNVWTTGYQTQADVAVRANGSFHVVWRSPGVDGAVSAIETRRFASSGVPLSDEITVNTNTVGPHYSPSVSSGGAPGFVVTWSWDGGASPFDARARRLAVDGDPETAELAVNAWTTGDQKLSQVAANADGSFVVAWESGAPGLKNVVAREFAADGAAIGGDFAVNTYVTGDQETPRLSMLPGGELAVVWQSNGQDGSSYGVFGRRLRSDRIFAEEFASSTFGSFWTVANPDGDLAITAQAGLVGSPFGLQAVLDDTTPIYLQNDLPHAERRYRVRFYLDPNGLTVGQDGERVKILQLFATDPAQRRLLTLVLRRQAGQYQLLAKFHQANDTWVNTGFHSIADGPHYVELDLNLFGPTGELRLWIDGVLASDVLDLLHAGGGYVDFARWGIIAVKPGAAGALYFDLFESRRETYIGGDS